MTLSDLLSSLPSYKTAQAGCAGAADVDITDITADSRHASPGAMFVATRGVSVDGHQFIAKAIENGATCVVAERIPEGGLEMLPSHLIYIIVENSVEALGALADKYFGSPSRKLTLVGVTGTNGKTTIATLLYEMHMAAGIPSGLISTVENRIAAEREAATHTTPDVVTIHRLLRRMVDAGCRFAAMEVSSHAAHQRRIAGLHFAGGIFTNLTRDHLDYHKTLQNYLLAKQSFFDSLGSDAFALTNADESHGAIMLQNTRAQKASYSLRGTGTFNGRIIEDRLGGMLIEIDRTEVETRLTGRFNASNMLAVYGAMRLLGHDKDTVLRLLSLAEPPAGRMQTMTKGGIAVVVDYAHTPDALANVLGTLAEAVRHTSGSIITVVGAGGDRDRGKRPLMAAEAVKASRMAVFTSDNPRHEEPAAIIDDMLEGVGDEFRHKVEVCVDRREAIRRAISLARPGDAVLIAGKGHEDYQIIGDVKSHFDDREEVAAALASL